MYEPDPNVLSDIMSGANENSAKLIWYASHWEIISSQSRKNWTRSKGNKGMWKKYMPVP
jgi:hypothetical protein